MIIYYDPNGKILSMIEDENEGFSVHGTPLTLDNTTWSDLWSNPQNYTIENGQPVYTPIPAATLLSDAQQAQIDQVNSGLNQTLVGGFTSKTTGHTYVTTTNGQANMEGDLKRFELDSTLASVQFYTVDKGWIAHSHQDLINAFLDGGKWKDAQYAQAQNLISQIQAVTESTPNPIQAVQAITWSEATY